VLLLLLLLLLPLLLPLLLFLLSSPFSAFLHGRIPCEQTMPLLQR
jgi:hypothetical protein